MFMTVNYAIYNYRPRSFDKKKSTDNNNIPTSLSKVFLFCKFSIAAKPLKQI